MSEKSALQPQLDAVKAEMMTQMPDEVKTVLGDAARLLAESDLLAGARQKGEAAPGFSLRAVDGSTVTLQSLLANGPTVLVFYRGAWCPYCNLQFKALQGVLPEIEAAGGTLVGISPSTPDNSLSMAQKQELQFNLLSDVGNVVSRSYGLIYKLDSRLWPIYKSFGIDIPATNGDDSYELPIAATYVIDGAGTIKAAFLDTDYTHRMEPADILAALKEC